MVVVAVAVAVAAKMDDGRWTMEIYDMVFSFIF